MYDLKAWLKDLKFSLKFPQIHLTSTFDAITNEIDLAAEKEIFEIDSSRHLIQDVDSKITLINSERTRMIEKIKEHSSALIGNVQVSETKKNLLENSVKIIESELKNLFSQNIAEMENLLYEVYFDLERVIFNNQTVVFLSKEILDGNQFGTLIFVQDEFIGTKGIQYLKFVHSFITYIQTYKLNFLCFLQEKSYKKARKQPYHPLLVIS